MLIYTAAFARLGAPSWSYAHACMLSCFSLVTPWTIAHQNPWASPGKNIEVGCYVLLQRIFPTWGSNLRLLPLLLGRWALYHYCHLGSLVYTSGTCESDLTSMLPIRRAGSITLKVLSIKYQIAVSSGRQSRQPPNWRAWSFCFSVLKLTLNDTLIPVLQNLANSALHLNTL